VTPRPERDRAASIDNQRRGNKIAIVVKMSVSCEWVAVEVSSPRAKAISFTIRWID
jgi:hypothetical protein